MVSAMPGSAILRCHTSSPVALLSANMRPSSEIEMILSFHSATPRLLDAAAGPRRPRRRGRSRDRTAIGTWPSCRWSYRWHRRGPHPSVTYITPVLDDRGRFERGVLVDLAAGFGAGERGRERELQIFDVAGVDVFQGRISVTLVVAVVQKPVLRFPWRR